MNKEKNEVSISFFWSVLRRSWLVLLIAVVIASMLTGLITQFVLEKKYSSSVTFYVVNNTRTDYISSSYLSATEQLANDYIDIICSDTVMIPLSEHLRDEHGIDYSATALKKKVSTSTKEDSSIFYIKITDVNSEHAYIIASSISEIAPQIIKDIVKDWATQSDSSENTAKESADCVKVIEQPKLDAKHDSPSLIKNLAIAVLLSASGVYAIFFLIAFNDTVIKTEEDIKKYTDKYPLIGVIPYWENN